MLNSNINFTNFKVKKKSKKLNLELKNILKKNNEVIQSLKKT